MSELKEKLRRRSILNGEAAPAEGEVVAPIVHDVPTISISQDADPASSELKQKLHRRSILNGEAEPQDGMEVKPIIREVDSSLGTDAIVISDELKDKLVHRRTVNGEAETVKELTKEVEIFQLFRQESQFHGNPMLAPKKTDGQSADSNDNETSASDEDHKLRVCEAILRRKTVAEMEAEAAAALAAAAAEEGSAEASEVKNLDE